MRIAIVGTGVSGLVAAHRLHARHDLTLFEQDDRIGGHVHTWPVALGGREWPVDTGFIVHNHRNYPRFTALLDEIGVESSPSRMSFSVRDDAARLEYNAGSLRELLANPANLVRPAFLRMLAEIVRFARDARARRGTAATVGAFLDAHGYSAAFAQWYLTPLGSAIWSLPLGAVREMPFHFFAGFLENHGMLDVSGRPVWRVIRGGSSAYVRALTAPFADRIRLRTPVRRIERTPHEVRIDGEPFDRVILATHADDALRLLADPTPAERAVLGALPFQRNDVVLHTDTRVLPRRRAAWAAWNYRVGEDPAAPAAVTYCMNILQGFAGAPETFCVTLNDPGTIDPARVIGRVRYHHPVVTVEGTRARLRRSEISGAARTHFCGAYWGSGFHEDGVESAFAVADEIAAARDLPLLAAR
jgi:predicted NAD/FAD-binding protein